MTSLRGCCVDVINQKHSADWKQKREPPLVRGEKERKEEEKLTGSTATSQ